MKKIYSLALLTIFSSSVVFAQGGPDAYGYTWKDTTYNWIDITSTGTLVTGLEDDNDQGPFNIGFSFQYYWLQMTEFYVGSNGFLALAPNNNLNNTISSAQSPAPAWPFIPTADSKNNYLAALMTDLSFEQVNNNPGKCYYWSNNTDTLIVSFVDVPFWNFAAGGWAGANTLQFILSGADSSITFQYGDLQGQWDPAYASSTNPVVIGIENISGTVGLEHSNTVLPPDSIAVRFEYPDTVTYSVIDVQPNWANNSSNGGFFMINNVADSITASVSNIGNTDVTSAFDCNTRIYTSSGGAPNPPSIFNELYTIDSIKSGEKIAFGYANTFTPTSTGAYHVRTQTKLGSDLINANDSIETEMNVIDTTGGQVVLTYTDSTADSVYCPHIKGIVPS